MEELGYFLRLHELLEAAVRKGARKTGYAAPWYRR